MYCQKCGFQLFDGSKFCPECATPVANSVQETNHKQYYDYQAEKKAIRESEKAEITKVYNYFASKQEAFNEYDMVCGIINDCRRISFAHIIRYWSIVVGFIFTAPLVFTSLLLVENFLMSTVIIYLIFSPIILFGIYRIVSSIVKFYANKKTLAMAEERYAELAQEIYMYYCNYPNCPIGIAYTNPRIIYKIITILQSGRADTIKESLNIIIADEKNRELTARLNNLQVTADKINASAGTAAAFSAANFFFS